RILKSNLAILPQSGLPIQWRLADIDTLRFDEPSYSIVLESDGQKLVLGKLAKKTDEAMGRLCGAVDAFHTATARVLPGFFPFLSAGALRRLQTVLPEGRRATLPELAAIDRGIPDALIEQAVDEPMRPYFDALRQRAQDRPLFAGFKFLRFD